MKSRFSVFAVSALGLAAFTLLASSACTYGHTNTNPLATVSSQQPDKVLYDRAMADIDHGKYSVARLTLETLINAYPDSEYLARAKMGIADAWYREGGTDGLTQAEAQYKDFITFFPTMNEASEAQLKVATIHFRQIEKADRDPTEAEDAQTELRTFLVMYPESPLRNQALQMLRDVQEVLAEREDKIARFYLQRQAYRAAQSRFEDVVTHYPLYSGGDALMETLAESYQTTARDYAAGAAAMDAARARAQAIMDNERATPQLKEAAAAVVAEDTRRRDLMKQDGARDQAKSIADFTALIERYPVSPYAAEARKNLIALHAPVPTPTAAAIAFNKAEIAGRGTYSRFDTISGMLHAQPRKELAMADKVGVPALTASQQTADAMPFGGADTALVANTDGSSVGGSPGGVVTPTATPSSTYANNFGDVSASGVSDTDTTTTPAAKNDLTVLTPSEIDIQEQEAITAEDIENNPPLVDPKAMAKAAAATPDPNAKPKKKSLFSHILPLG